MLPSQYIDTLLRAYTRNPSKYQILKEAFEEFSSYREALDPDTAVCLYLRLLFCFLHTL